MCADYVKLLRLSVVDGSVGAFTLSLAVSVAPPPLFLLSLSSLGKLINLACQYDEKNVTV